MAKKPTVTLTMLLSIGDAFFGARPSGAAPSTLPRLTGRHPRISAHMRYLGQRVGASHITMHQPHTAPGDDPAKVTPARRSQRYRDRASTIQSPRATT